PAPLQFARKRRPRTVSSPWPRIRSRFVPYATASFCCSALPARSGGPNSSHSRPTVVLILGKLLETIGSGLIALVAAQASILEAFVGRHIVPKQIDRQEGAGTDDVRLG